MDYKAVVIGGSAGSFQIITKILASLPRSFNIPVFLCLHRLKHIRSGFDEALSIKSVLPVVEPMDKEYVRNGKVYLAPANYHMYVEVGNQIALSTEEVVNHSRPSIDLCFYSAAYTYKEKAVGILLSGANRDGATGLKLMRDQGGLTIAQAPEDCQVKTMTSVAIKEGAAEMILTADEIVSFLSKLA